MSKTKSNILASIIIVSISAYSLGQVSVPRPPQLDLQPPSGQSLVPPTIEELDGAPTPAGHSVRHSVSAVTVPNDTQLKSILRRNLPQADQTLRITEAPEWFQNMMQRIVRENVPDKYVRDKDWGKTGKRWDGLEVRRKGALQLTTKRKWKEVNHGTWKRYEITQLDPDQNLLLRIENVADAGRGRIGFEVELASKLHVHGRLAKWAKGVQLYNVSADADAAVTMRLWCEVGMKLDVSKFPPDVVMDPKVVQGNLHVSDFRLQSVSKLKGPVVKQLSGSVHRVLLDKIAEKREQLPQKINKQIAKNEDKMRLSMADFAASKWSSFTGNAGDRDSKSGVLSSNHESAQEQRANPSPSPAATSARKSIGFPPAAPTISTLR